MTVNTSDLDFVNIKGKLKTYFQNSPEFKDYNFDASGLSSILDVLAYNTHINALIANMAINESFLSTSQLRSSVLGHAESLGYTPRSKSSAMATVDVIISDPQGVTTEEIIGPRTRFNTEVDDSSFVFYTNREYVASRNDDDQFIFSGVDLYEGKERTKTFFADADVETVFVIPDEDIDTSTMIVEVYENSTSDVSVRYKNILTAPAITNNSRVYMLRETPAGEYEMYFGDGELLGIRPSAGNVITVSYIATSSSDANGASNFNLDAFNGYSKQVVTISPASGGSEKESIAEIKVNAPRAFATQQRLVTAEDYTSTIKSLYGQYLKDVISWGGNDNIPPKFGSVFVSINFLDGYTESIKDEIKTLIRDNLTDFRSIMSIETEFVDPEVVYLKLTTLFNLDSTLSTVSTEVYKQQISDLISNYFFNEMDKFGSIFRRSNLLSLIDDQSPAILNSKMEIVAQRQINTQPYFDEIDDYHLMKGTTPPDFIERDITVNFPFTLALPDKDDYVITTSTFRYLNQNAVIKNELGSYRLQVYDTNNNVLLSNVGEYQPASGEVNFRAWNIQRDSNRIIEVTATPGNQSTITPLRNYLFELSDDSVVLVNVERDGTKVLL
jgi:hypothetical protein